MHLFQQAFKRRPRLACIGPIMVDRYVPPRGRHILEILDSLRETGVVRGSAVLEEELLHRVLSPVATLVRIKSFWPLIVDSSSDELSAIARGTAENEDRGDDVIARGDLAPSDSDSREEGPRWITAVSEAAWLGLIAGST